MNPMFYGTFAFLGFMSFFFALGFWMLRGLAKEEDRKRAAGFTTSPPASRARLGE
ncbi:MAG TPA: hypothetical protein VGQ21_21440 [Thermoanaerobaculia bacterium]|jgi:hypothetical protein|nr:hypothetical protein [Thermoanaerobaculia bacterium]